MKNIKKLPNWCNFFIIEDFFTKIFLRKTVRLSKLVEISVEERKKILEHYEKLCNHEIELKEDLKKPESFLRSVYTNTSPKKNVISSWAEILEKKYEDESKLGFDLTVESIGAISSHIKSYILCRCII